MQRQRKNSTGREQALEVQRTEKTSGVLGIQEGWCGWSRRSERKYQVGVSKSQMVCSSTQIAVFCKRWLAYSLQYDITEENPGCARSSLSF